MFIKRDRNEIREIRHARVRKKISGTPDMPRLSVYRSNKHIQAQIIDDTKGVTLAAASHYGFTPEDLREKAGLKAFFGFA